jgi:DNA topoisomerase-1
MDMTLLEELQTHGYQRRGSPRSGFRYLTPGGQALRNGEVARIRSLRLPPAWSDVYVAPAPKAKLQAIGKDRAGRWQYRYHPAWRQRQENAKYRRLVRFAAALPRMRAAVAADLRRKGLVRERVLAAAVHVLATCFMRAGSKVYAERHQSYGVATLKARHVTVEGDLVRFHYTGKSKVHHVRELRDARIARIVKELLRTPGPDLFKFVDDEGRVVDVRRRHINAYIRQAMGGPFTAKDFRTWAGTLLCACELARQGQAEQAQRKKLLVAAVKATAERLGNTPAVCRASYIFPAVLQGFTRGKVIGAVFGDLEELARQRGLHGAERALLTFLSACA